MAPLAQYLMPRDAEIALAKSAAPAGLSGHATVLVLGRHGYETAVRGSNGFVCMVERGWTGTIDFPERWNPKLRGPDCSNPPAARSILPMEEMVTQLTLAGKSKRQIATALKMAYRNGSLPALAPGAMGFMMSKHAYLTDADDHNLSHLMVFTNLSDPRDWGSNAADSPVSDAFFWFPGDESNPLARGLPMIRIFIVSAGTWSDGTPVQSGR